MNHSPSEIEALESSIEVVPSNTEFQKVLIDSIERGHTHSVSKSPVSRRRITIKNQDADYSVVFDQAQNVIAEMRAAYEEMFENWNQESEMNSRLMKEVDDRNLTIDSQKKFVKKVLDEKSQIQEELDKVERVTSMKPNLQDKVEDLESELKSLKIELEQLKTDKERQNMLLEEKTKTLEFYRTEFGVQKEDDVVVEFRPRLLPVRRTHSSPNTRRISKNIECNASNRRVTKNVDDRKLSTGPSKLLSMFSKSTN